MTTEQYPGVHMYRRVVRAKLFIDNNYHDPINVDNIADEAYFSKFHFIRLFKSVYGKTPNRYLMAVRIEKAKEFLQSDKSVSEACSSVGFESLSSFSGLFKKMTGSTPSVFLKQHQEAKKARKKAPLKFVPGCFISNNGWDENSNFREMTD
ncbi:MAG: helix-turn-helix domain-containing protein [Imperialibacter sp.]|uniref:helix-turn-helix domain-containing protein n=1 Tax=Imperialibacter sp. TaxID=2038411 RepID=UPI0030D790E4|tara:strand:- start:256 stop:708 length:453 start_codon:yes stop_codon:yes gene_type:complete